MEPFKDLSDVDLFELNERTNETTRMERASIDLCVRAFFWQFVFFFPLFPFLSLSRLYHIHIHFSLLGSIYWKVVPSSHWFLVYKQRL